MTDYPLIEQEAGSESVTASSGSSNTSEGPSLKLTFSDGSEVTIGPDELLLYLVVVQTLCFLYLVYTEMKR